MRLVEGQKAPDFVKTDVNGNRIALSDYRGVKVLISFFRDAACPFCNLRIRELIRRHKEFSIVGIEIITFFTSDREEIMKYEGREYLTFKLIPDDKMEVYRKYRIKSSLLSMLKSMFRIKRLSSIMKEGLFTFESMKKNRNTVPAEFLIDEDGILYYVHYGMDFGDHLSIDKILTWMI